MRYYIIIWRTFPSSHVALTKDACFSLKESSAMSISEFLPPLIITSLRCREDFFEQNFTCLPRCDSWDGRPHNSLVVTADIVQVVCATLELLFTILTIVVFVIRRKAL